MISRTYTAKERYIPLYISLVAFYASYRHTIASADLYTASYVGKSDGLLEFDIRVLVPNGKRWEHMTTLSREKSLIGVHGALLGYEKVPRWFYYTSRITTTFFRMTELPRNRSPTLRLPRNVPLAIVRSLLH